MTVGSFQRFLYVALGGKALLLFGKTLQGVLVAHSWYSHICCSLENTNIKEKKNKLNLLT